MPRTSYCFLTGLISTLSMDWTGHGPTAKQWRVGLERDFRRHGIGMIVGFCIMLTLLLAAFALGMANHTVLAMFACLLMLVCIVAANAIALRLP